MAAILSEPLLNLVADNSTIVRQQGLLSIDYVMCYEYF